VTRLRPTTLLFLLWLGGWPAAMLVYGGTTDPCGPAGQAEGSNCTPMEDYGPTLLFMGIVWFIGLVAAGFVCLSRRTK
jgi:hypothetical protein